MTHLYLENTFASSECNKHLRQFVIIILNCTKRVEYMNNLTQIDKPLLCYINTYIAAQTPLTCSVQKSNCLKLPSIYMMTLLVLKHQLLLPESSRMAPSSIKFTAQSLYVLGTISFSLGIYKQHFTAKENNLSTFIVS